MKGLIGRWKMLVVSTGLFETTQFKVGQSKQYNFSKGE